jgi:hypothetical protein
MIELKKMLLNNPDHIENLLEKYDFHNINVGSREIRCGIDEDSNITSIRIKLNEKLTSTYWTKDIHGDLFSLIVQCKNVELRDVIRSVKEELGITHFEFRRNKKIFGGFYDNIKTRRTNSFEIKTYPREIMKCYSPKYNTLFLKDGISLSTQKKYSLGICHSSSRATVPWFDYEGNLVGIEGRYLGDYEKDEIPKWFPVIPFSKSQFLFGYYNNYQYLQSCDDIYIGESSKFTMQLDTMGKFNGVALGGNSIHNQQIKQLSWLNPKRIIFCLDEGLDEEIVKRQVEKTRLLLKFFDIKIGYVVDKKNKILRKGGKQSPSDVGLNGFNDLVENYVEWS